MAFEKTTLRKKRSLIVLLILGALAVAVVSSGLYLYQKAVVVRDNLEAAKDLLPSLRSELERGDASAAQRSAENLVVHTTSARESTEDAAWGAAGALPFIGGNFQAIRELAISADDVARLGVVPLAEVYETIDWTSLLPGSAEALEPLRDAEPKISAASKAVTMSAARLEGIETTELLDEVAQPFSAAKQELTEAAGLLNDAASVAKIGPSMLGSDEPRRYLLMIQNNAESRASGGIPGALAELSVDSGQMKLTRQSSAAEIGPFIPAVPVDTEQQNIFSTRLGKFMQDVNLTPDFPTSAATARSMWQSKIGDRLDGVVSVDPVALSYILKSTGPVRLSAQFDEEALPAGLPSELTEQNVVRTLMSDVYTKIASPKMQDAYFAAVAQQVFDSLSKGKSDSRSLLAELAHGVDEGRVRVWSSHESEQAVLSNYAIGGAITGKSVSPTQFGVYFNDGTGAKMDFYMRRTVQLIKACPVDGYEQTTVRITSANTAPADAGTSLPGYVTGDGLYGVPPGSIQTNVVVYGPVQALIETSQVDGRRTAFAPYLHSNRPVGVHALRLAPGESQTLEFTFGKIVQHTEPNLAVTPTIQPVNEVVLPTEAATCGS